MVFDSTLSIIEFGLNAGFMIISMVLLGIFIYRLESEVNYFKPNIMGFILLALGLSFHILGNLTAQLIANTQIYQQGLSHLIAAFIALSVVIFILGTALIVYNFSTGRKQEYIKWFAYVFTVVGSLDVLFHLFIWVNGETITIFGIEQQRIELVYVLIEMIALSIIYVLMYFQGRASVNKARAIRYKLLAITALGFVVVIMVDTIARLGIIQFGDVLAFWIYFFLHVITVGALGLLILFPKWFQNRVGL